jgi:Tfp pilus assembly protein PilN
VAVIEKCKDLYTFNLYVDSTLVNTALVRTEDDLKEKIYENKLVDIIFLAQERDDINEFILKDLKDNDDWYIFKNVEYWERSKQSLGAALNGLSECLNRFNVLKIKGGKRYISQLALTGMLSLLILAFAFILPGIIKHKKVQSIRVIDARLEELHPKVMIASRLRDEIYSVLETTNKINDIVKSKSHRIQLLAELTRAIPDDTWIKQLSFKKGNFEIEVVGLSGAKVLTSLENSPKFQHVSFTSSVVKDRSGKEKFKIKGNTR